jgi:hypothetical protein
LVLIVVRSLIASSNDEVIGQRFKGLGVVERGKHVVGDFVCGFTFTSGE